MTMVEKVRNGINGRWTPGTKVRVRRDIDDRRTYWEIMMRYFP